jgi:hypothetical protein
MVTKGHVSPFWKDEFKNLSYSRQPFSNQEDVAKWINMGYVAKHFTGQMYVAKSPAEAWIEPFFNLFPGTNTGVTFYKMETSVVMPAHTDSFTFFIKNYNIVDQTKIKRALVFLEDWKSGHNLEVDNYPVTQWKAGDYVIWDSSTPQLAANIGFELRYTAQIT